MNGLLALIFHLFFAQPWQAVTAPDQPGTCAVVSHGEVVVGACGAVKRVRRWQR